MAKWDKSQVDKSAITLKGSGAQGKEGAQIECLFLSPKEAYNFGCLKPQESDHNPAVSRRTTYFSVDNFHGSGQEGIGLADCPLHLSFSICSLKT